MNEIYKLIGATTESHFIDMVNAWISKGYEPYGNTIVFQRACGKIQYYQPMMKG